MLNNIIGAIVGIFIVVSVLQSAIKFFLAFKHKRFRNSNGFDKCHHSDQALPSATILVPAYNEALVIERTIENLLQLDYSNYKVIVIDDGSTDNTFQLVDKLAQNEPRLSVYSIANSKRAGALNHGLTKTEAEFVVCTDADSLLEPQAVRIAINRLLQNSNLGAVAGNLRVGNIDGFLTACQSIEYDALNHSRFAQNTYRKVNLVPGPVGIFRHSMLKQAGGFSTETFAEDTDLTASLIERNYDVYYEPKCIVWTEAPNSLTDLYAQRYRWVRGLMQVIKKHLAFIWNSGLFSRITLLTLINTFAWSFLTSLVLLVAGIAYLVSINNGASSPIGYLWLTLFSLESLSQMISVLVLQRRIPIVLLVPLKILIYDSLRCLWSFKFIGDEIVNTEMTWNKLERYGTSMNNTLASKQSL